MFLRFVSVTSIKKSAQHLWASAVPETRVCLRQNRFSSLAEDNEYTLL